MKKRACRILDFAASVNNRVKNQRKRKEKEVFRPERLGKGWKCWKLEDETRPSKLQDCKDQQEYLEVSWLLEKTCCHSNSNKKSTNAGVKNLQGIMMITYFKHYSLVLKMKIALSFTEMIKIVCTVALTKNN